MDLKKKTRIKKILCKNEATTSNNRNELKIHKISRQPTKKKKKINKIQKMLCGHYA